jgi:HEPN domain-containing protein
VSSARAFRSGGKRSKSLAMANSRTPACLAYAADWLVGSERELTTAQTLKSQGKDWPNVYWHAGFAVEHALKAIRVKRDGLELWPQTDKSAKWHRIEFLAERAGLQIELANVAATDVSLGAYWLTVKDWDQQKRYPGNNPTEAEARDLLTAVANPISGVMKWLRQNYQNL